ncbi:hypothetical protein D3C84_929050 [compost metagenome]
MPCCRVARIVERRCRRGPGLEKTRQAKAQRNAAGNEQCRVVARQFGAVMQQLFRTFPAQIARQPAHGLRHVREVVGHAQPVLVLQF